jgi:hypothetical protein
MARGAASACLRVTALVERRHEIVLPIAACSAWAPGLESEPAWRAWTAEQTLPSREGAPALGFVDPLMRRRLSRAARMALHVANACLQGRAADRTVVASRHGELHRTVGMLHELGRGHDLSPTDFSLSVHNAVAGIHSIVRRDRSPSIAVAAGAESFAYGLVEAASQWLRDSRRTVLLIYAEEPAPSEYRSFIRPNECPHALALLISRDAPISLRVGRRPADTGDSAPEMQSLAFLRTWMTRELAASWRGERCVWEWGVVDAV